MPAVAPARAGGAEHGRLFHERHEQQHGGEDDADQHEHVRKRHHQRFAANVACKLLGRGEACVRAQPREGARSSGLDAILRDHCKQKLAAYKAPRSFEFVAELGRSDAGKINRQALARAREQEAT